MKTKLLFFVLCVLIISCTQNKQTQAEQGSNNISDMMATHKVEDETTKEIKEYILNLNVRDFFYPSGKETEMLWRGADGKVPEGVKEIYSIIYEGSDSIMVNHAYLSKVNETWGISADHYITYSVKNNEIIEDQHIIKILGTTRTNSSSEPILKLPSDSNLIEWEYTTGVGKEKGTEKYSAQLKYFKAEKAQGGFLLIPAIEVIHNTYHFDSDSGKWIYYSTPIKEYWGKDWGLLIQNLGIFIFNSKINPSTYQILDFENGYKIEKSIKAETTNDEPAIYYQQTNDKTLSIDTFSEIPDDVDGCSCTFSNDSIEYNKKQYIFTSDITKVLYMKINGKMIKFNLNNDGSVEMNSIPHAGSKIKIENSLYKIVIEYDKVIEAGYETRAMTGTIQLTDIKSGNTVVKKIFGVCGC